MSDFDEEPEPDEEEREAAHSQQVTAEATTVSIEGVPLAAIEAAVNGTVQGIIHANGWADQAKREIKKAAQLAVDSLTPEVARDALGVEVARVVADGIPTFDSYTGKETARTTIREMVVKALNETKGDRYAGGGQTIVQQTVKAAVDDAKVAVRAQVDLVLQGKLTEALRAALGLR